MKSCCRTKAGPDLFRLTVWLLVILISLSTAKETERGGARLKKPVILTFALSADERDDERRARHNARLVFEAEKTSREAD